MRSDLKEIRERLGLTQNELAVRADVSLSIISRLESGRIQTVSSRVARKLAAAYGIESESILGGNVMRPGEAQPRPADSAA